MATSKEAKALLLRFDITQTLQIKLTRLKVYTFSHKGAKPHKCHLCKYSSKYKSSVKIHMRTHTGEKPFSCTLCNYKSSQRQCLNHHILTHTGEKPWNCVFCLKSFSAKSLTTRHEKTCKLNPRQNDPSWVEMQRAFKCQLCPYSTTQKSHLKIHILTHTGEKPFLCTLCKKTFTSTNGLRSHIFTHTREKPHSCQFCTKVFSQVTDQKKHEKICKLNPQQGDAKWVEEQKKFKCHLCKYTTITKESLEIHLRSHTGEKPFKCPLCLYKCSNNSNLHKHVRRKHVKAKCYTVSKCGVLKSFQ